MTKLRYVRESICSCGFPALSTQIPIGTEYTQLLPIRQDATFICGSCGTAHQVKAVYVTRPGDRGAGWVPAELFEPCDKVEEAI